MTKKKEFGLNDLINQTVKEQTKETATAPAAPAKKTATYVKVCYNLDAELVEQIKVIAYCDRRKVNATVTAALEKAVEAWKKDNDFEAARTLYESAN